MEISPFYRIKCLLCGEINTGKSSIVHLATSEESNLEIASTIGIGFNSMKIELEEYPILNPQKLPDYYFDAYKDREEDDKEEKEEIKIPNPLQLIRLHIWDSSGSMRFRSFLNAYMRDIDICFLVFDISKRSSWNQLSAWKKEVEENSLIKPQYVLIASKCDLKNHEVTREEIKKQANEWNAPHYIISSRQPDSFLTVRRIFYESVKRYHESLLILQNEGKELSDKVLSSYYVPKESVYIDLNGGEKSRF